MNFCCDILPLKLHDISLWLRKRRWNASRFTAHWNHFFLLDAVAFFYYFLTKSQRLFANIMRSCKYLKFRHTASNKISRGKGQNEILATNDRQLNRAGLSRCQLELINIANCIDTIANNKAKMVNPKAMERAVRRLANKSVMSSLEIAEKRVSPIRGIIRNLFVYLHRVSQREIFCYQSVAGAAPSAREVIDPPHWGSTFRRLHAGL